MKTRNVSLTPEIEAFINERVASGRFRSASEVVRAALRLLEDRVASGRFRSASEVVRAALRLLEDEEHRRETSGQRNRGASRPARSPVRSGI